MRQAQIVAFIFSSVYLIKFPGKKFCASKNGTSEGNVSSNFKNNIHDTKSRNYSFTFLVNLSNSCSNKQRVGAY
jgi:hypothetical protein